MTEGAPRRQFRIDDAVDRHLPLETQLSPDGSTVLYVTGNVSREAEHPRTSVWSVAASGGAPRQFTVSSSHDWHPRWSPEGGRVAFLSDRKQPGKSQLYCIPADGGEAECLAERPEGISALAWSPDGEWIAFLSADSVGVEPGPGKADQCLVDEDMRRSRLYVVPTRGGEAKLISAPGNVQVWNFDWHPDGNRLLAVTTSGATADDESYQPSRVVEYALALSGNERELLSWPTGLEEARWSPDGQRIAFRSLDGRVHSADVLWLLEAGKAPRQLTRGFPGSVVAYTWMPGGEAIRFLAYQDMWTNLSDVSITEPAVVTPVQARTDVVAKSEISFSDSRDSWAFVGSGTSTPPEVFVASRDGGPYAVSRISEALANVDLCHGSVITWPSSDGCEISGLLYLPPNAGGTKPPLVLHIHGGPAWLWAAEFHGSWSGLAQLLISRGYAVLMPNPRGSIGRGTAFTDAEVNDMGGMEVDDLLAGVDDLVARGIVDPAKLGVAGWSHGGYLTGWLITQTDRFKAAVIGAGPANLVSDHGQNDIPGFNRDYYDDVVYDNPDPYWKRSPLARAGNVSTPALILHGENDERVTVPQGKEFFRALKHHGVPTRMVIYPREGHSIQERAHQRDLLERTLAWFDNYLACKPCPGWRAKPRYQ